MISLPNKGKYSGRDRGRGPDFFGIALTQIPHIFFKKVIVLTQRQLGFFPGNLWGNNPMTQRYSFAISVLPRKCCHHIFSIIVYQSVSILLNAHLVAIRTPNGNWKHLFQKHLSFWFLIVDRTTTATHFSKKIGFILNRTIDYQHT